MQTICTFAPCSRQITTPTPHHLIFTGQMLFLTSEQQHQSTEGKKFVAQKLLQKSYCDYVVK